jgi:hypothetical protein
MKGDREMRKVKATIYNRELKKRIEISGLFHGWGVAYEEYHAGPGNYTTALIELADGRVVTAMPEDVIFLT